MESNSKLNIYTILLLPLLAAAVGGLVLLGIHLFADPVTQGPATHPIPAHTELAIGEVVKYLGNLLRVS